MEKEKGEKSKMKNLGKFFGYCWKCHLLLSSTDSTCPRCNWVVKKSKLLDKIEYERYRIDEDEVEEIVAEEIEEIVEEVIEGKALNSENKIIDGADEDSGNSSGSEEETDD